MAIRRRDSRAFTSHPVNVAVECGLYELPDDVAAGFTQAETALGPYDAAAIAAIRNTADAGEAPEPGSAERSSIANFLALLVARTPEQRERWMFAERVREYAAGQDITKALVAEYLEHVHLGFKPRDPEVVGAYEFVTDMPQVPGAVAGEGFVRSMFSSVPLVVPLLLEMNWTLEVDRKSLLITSDMPLVLWRRPSFRDKFEGMGIESAEELRFPLDPRHQLVLSHRRRTPVARIPAQRARQCNEDMAAACYEFVVSNPRHLHVVELLPLSRKRPALRFNTAPLFLPQSDGTRRKTDDEVLHMWVPRR